MIFRTHDNRTVQFTHGVLSGDLELVEAIQEYVREGRPTAHNYWGAVPASLASEWRAYLAIGGVLQDLSGMPPQVSVVPENPDGYEAEGVIL